MKRAEQLAKTRQAILKTATTLFLQKGFSGASTRDIAKQIEFELEYPGQIKVNVIRESRVIDYAK